MIGIFIDLDGTLLNEKWEISKEDSEYIKSIKHKHKIYLITGSSYTGAVKYYKELGLDTWLTTSQGQEMSKPNENYFKRNFIQESIVKKIYDNNEGLPFFVEGEKYFYQSKDFNIPIRINKKLTHDFNKIKKALMIITRKKPNIEKDINYYKWEPTEGDLWFITNNKLMDKSNAVKAIIKEDKLDYSIYLGDGRNDIAAMNEVNHSIAMKNSYEMVKQAAKETSKYDNKNSGVSRAIKKHLKERGENEI